MANNLAQSQKLITAAQSAARRHGIMQSRRFLPGLRRVKAVIDSGVPGAILNFVMAMQIGRRPMTDGRDNIQSLAMMFAAIASAETGQRVDVRPHEREDQ